MPRPHRTLGFLACALACALWGSGFFFGKIALTELGVGHMVFYRFFFGALALSPFLFTHPTHFTPREWRLLLFSAFLGIPLQFLIQFKGLSLTTVSHASLMIGTMPVILAIGAAVFAHERMDLTGWIAIAVSASGAALIAIGGRHGGHGQASVTGDLLVVLSLVIALFWILLNKHLLQSHSAIVVTSWVVVSGAAMLAVIVFLTSGLPPVAHISPKVWGALVISGIFCTATTTLCWNWGIARVPASQAGILINMEPLVGSMLGILVLGETLGPSAWVGAALILAAAIVLTTHSKTKVRAPAPQ